VASDEGGLEEVTIGLKRHTVQVVAHRDEWRGLFEREMRALRERIGHLVVDVQHVGSTAVPGLDAKPIIDIAVAVPSTEVIQRRPTHKVVDAWLSQGWRENAPVAKLGRDLRQVGHRMT